MKLPSSFNQATFCVLSALVATTLASITDVKNDLPLIITGVQTLNNDFVNFLQNGVSFGGAMIIHNDVVNLAKAIDQGTKDAKTVTAGTVSESDGQDILSSIETIRPIILNALNEGAAKRDAVANLMPGVATTAVLMDLKSLSSSASEFGNALIAIAPASLQAQASSVKSDIDAGFANAIAAYSS